MLFQLLPLQLLILDLIINILHSSLKKKISTIVQTIAKKYKCKPIIKFSETGTAFITKPGKTVQMMSQVIKKITNNKFDSIH